MNGRPAVSERRRALQDFVAQELDQPVSPLVRAMADVIRQRFGAAATAVLFYGSCLRRPETQLGDSLLDFYVLVDDYRRAYPTALPAWANHLLPPNVFYLELEHGGTILRAKYAVISQQQFARGTSPAAPNVSLWARFCQPVRLVWSRDSLAAAAAAAACSEAVLTMLAAWGAQPTAPNMALSEDDILQRWIGGFQETYRAELRPEGSDRAVQIVAVDAARYQQITPLAQAVLAEQPQPDNARSAWRRSRLLGKLFNIARLAKATFTFEGGLDYALWKIARHSGITVEVTDWQRRHPLLSAPGLAWRLYRRGAFR
ncbi:MAG TPA: hypothetical protein VN229_21480 [Terriglobales bacterium]|nr:hypothetical protein [Terriglobales bacterium]